MLVVTASSCIDPTDRLDRFAGPAAAIRATGPDALS